MDGAVFKPDPLKLGGGLNTQSYVHNPLSWIDPLGLLKCGLTGNEVGNASNLPVIRPELKNGGWQLRLSEVVRIPTSEWQVKKML